MRLRNLSSRRLPRDLWFRLAALMGVGGTLPLAQVDDLGLYGACKSLRVTVRPVRRVEAGVKTVSASHTYGHISIAPCPACTVGALTHVFLHELVHAWLFQFHEPLHNSWNHCAFAERFADAAFAILGGTFRDRDCCGSYRLDVAGARRNLLALAVMTRDLTTTDRSRLRRWRPRSRSGASTIGLQANNGVHPPIVVSRPLQTAQRARHGARG